MNKIVNTHLNILNTKPIFDIELTNKCNINCSFCPNNAIQDKQCMDKQKILKLVDWLPSSSDVILSGLGEQLLNPHIFLFIKKLKEKSIGTSLITNGLLLTEYNIKKLLQSSIDEIQISIHTLNQTYYNSIIKNSNFNIIRENILNLSKFPVKIRLNVVKLAQSDEDIYELNEFSRSINAELFIRNFHNRGGFLEKGIEDSSGVCGIFFKVTYISQKGEIYSCVNDILKKNIIGSIETHNYNDILKIKQSIAIKNNLFKNCFFCNDEYKFIIFNKLGKL